MVFLPSFHKITHIYYTRYTHTKSSLNFEHKQIQLFAQNSVTFFVYYYEQKSPASNFAGDF